MLLNEIREEQKTEMIPSTLAHAYLQQMTATPSNEIFSGDCKVPTLEMINTF